MCVCVALLLNSKGNKNKSLKKYLKISASNVHLSDYNLVLTVHLGACNIPVAFTRLFAPTGSSCSVGFGDIIKDNTAIKSALKNRYVLSSIFLRNQS